MRKTTKRSIVTLMCLAFLFLFATQTFALWRYNPFTQKLDYYEEGLPISGAPGAGDTIYYDGANWQVLTAGANGLVLTLNAGLPTWMAAGAGDMLRAVYDIDVDGDIDTAAGGLEVDSSAWTDYAYVTAGIWAVDPVLSHVVGGLGITANADTASHLLGGADYTINWSDGELILQTDEGANTTTIVAIQPKGTNEISELEFHDTDGERLSIFTAADRSYITAIGGAIGINEDAAQDVQLFESAESGETPSVLISGFRAGDAIRVLDITVGGIANDRVDFTGLAMYSFDAIVDGDELRVTANADAWNVITDGTNALYQTTDGYHTFDTTEAVEAAIAIMDDDTHKVVITVPELAGDWTLTLPVDDGANLEFLQTDGNGVTSWVAGAGDAFTLKVDAGAAADFFGVAGGDGLFRFTANHFTMADGGNFVTLSLADHATARTALGLQIGNDVQAWDTDLDTYAGISPSANVQTLLANATFALFLADLSGTAGAAFDWNSQGLDGVASIDGPAAAMDINSAIVQDVNFWDGIASGNPSVTISGWNTAGGDLESVELTMDDANDEFLIQVPNSANNEGITFSLQETNQRFRIRQNADIGSIYMDGTDMQFHTTDGTFVFDSDEAAAVAALVLYDDDTNFVTIQSQEMAGNWVFTLPAADGAANDVLYDSDGSGTMAYATATSLVTAATTGAAGKVELATTTETSAGTDTGRVVTPDGLAGSDMGRKSMVWKLTPSDGVVPAGDNLDSIMVPDDFAGWLVVDVLARVITVDDAADDITIDIWNVTQAADVLSTPMTIDGGEASTRTAAIAWVIDLGEDDITAADVIRIDITGYAGDNAAGLEVHIVFERVT